MWPADVHVIGKDILKFHAVYWPAFLLSLGLPLPRQIIAHGWWTKDKKKISKSAGNPFDPVEKSREFGSDALRYYLLRECSFQDDPDYSDSQMIIRLNTELADTYGNLIMRCITKKINTESMWPDVPYSLRTHGQSSDISNMTPAQLSDYPLLVKLQNLPGLCDYFYTKPNIQKAILAVLDLLREANAFVNTEKPWKCIDKSTGKVKPEYKNTHESTLFIVLECVRISTLLLLPVMPNKCREILDQLGLSDRKYQIGLHNLKIGIIPCNTPLFPSNSILFNKVK